MRVRLPRIGRATLLLLVLALPICLATRAPATGTGADDAALSAPIGLWKTIDDKTGRPKAIVEIREANDTLDGRIVKLFNPPAPHPRCIKCSGALKDKPVMGMRILWGMRKDGDAWTGGHILDPENGNVYRCTITLEDGGKTLQVRGYIGLSMFGRTEKWVRADN